MIKYFCDKCDRELDSFEIFTITVAPPEIRAWADEARTGTCILCPNCLEVFEGWVKVRTVD